MPDLLAVTGATGHLGSVLAARLLKRGHRVRAIVRERSKLSDVSWLSDGRLEVAEADMSNSAAMHAALAGVQGLFHVAGAFDVATLSQEELNRTNLGGVEVVLRAAAAQGVRKVVLTSSAAAVGTSTSAAAVRSEADWNDSTREPYARSKMLAERRAWALAEELGLDLVAVLPGMILGPGFTRPTPSLAVVTDALAGKLAVAPPIDFAVTDVRDVADAHIAMYESTRAQGRYLVAGPTRTVVDVVTLIRNKRPIVPPARAMPKWFARIFPAMDAAAHVVTRQPRRMRSGFVTEYVGRTHALDTSRAQREIGWAPRPIETTILDTILWAEGKRDPESVVQP